MTDYYIHYREAKDEAERLSRVLGQNMEALSRLHEHGFKTVADGSAVIVIGDASRIPLDRPIGIHDLTVTTRARRFETARAAAATLLAD